MKNLNSDIGSDNKTTIFCEYQWKGIVEAVGFLRKSIGFYLAIMSGLIGYILTQDLTATLHNSALILGFATTAFAFIGAVAVGWGVINGLKGFQRSLKKVDPDTFNELEIGKYIRRGKRVGIILLTCSLLLLIIITFELSSLYIK